MKKLLLTAMLIATGAAFAYIPGDRPGATSRRLSWIDCSAMPLGPLNPELHRDIPDLRAIVFFYTRAQDTPATIAMLDDLRRQYSGKVLIAAITPDGISDAKQLREKNKDVRIRLAVDLERKLTPEYMSRTIMLFPMAFLMDKNGMILWRGEAVDLPEAIEKQLNGTLRVEDQKNVAPMIYTMQQNMRDGNMFKALDSAQAVLAADPGNPSALRMAIFAAENLNDHQRAWKLAVNEFIRNPDIPRLSFTLLDMISRYDDLHKYLPWLIRNFCNRPFNADVRCAFADRLLTRFSFDADAVLGAKTVLAGTPMALSANPGTMAYLLAVRGRLNYALGDLRAAESDLAESVEFFKRAGNSKGSEQAEKQLKFFRALLKEQQARP